MRRLLRRVFRPVYGTKIEVRPRRWWSLRGRRAARAAARLLNQPEVLAVVEREVARRRHDVLLAGMRVVAEEHERNVKSLTRQVMNAFHYGPPPGFPNGAVVHGPRPKPTAHDSAHGGQDAR